MSNNFRKYPKTKARRIQGHSSTSLQIQNIFWDACGGGYDKLLLIIFLFFGCSECRK
jgi:hypothetical protein